MPRIILKINNVAELSESRIAADISVAIGTIIVVLFSIII
jgi:hypothetical protein